MNVVITGASAGLGKALNMVFRSFGHTVIGTTHDSALAGVNADLVYFEAGQKATSIEDCVAAVMKLLGDQQVDVLINNAGTNAICPFEELTPTFVDTIMDVNFMTPVFMVQEFLPYFAKPATVINVISDAAWRPMRHSLAYNCSKAALDMATKQMARELSKPHELSLIGVRPGKMRGTGMSRYIDKRVQELRGWTPIEASNYFKQGSVTGFELDPSDVALFIHSIVTSGLARSMSGACVDLVG